MPSLLRKLIDLLEPRTRLRLLMAMIGSVLVAALDTAAVALVLPLVDLTSGKPITSGSPAVAASIFNVYEPEHLTTVLACAVVSLFILKNIGSLVFNWWLMGFVYFERVRTSSRMLMFYLSAPYTDVSRRSSAELMRTMDAAVLQVFSMSINGVMTAFASLVSIVAVVTALATVAPLPTMALAVYFASAGWLYTRLVKPRATAAGRDINAASAAGWKAAFAALGALKEVSLRGSQEVFVAAYRDAQLEGSRAGRVASVLGSLPRYILEVLFILAIGVVVVAGSSYGPSGGTIGVLAVFVAAGFRLLPSITSLVASVSNIRVGADSVDLVHDEVLRAREQAAHASRRTGSGPPLPFSRDLRVDGVRFRYPGADQDVLSDVSFSMPFGTSLAIVGGSGAGKTTLVDVILGLHQPSSGAVLVDGVDIRTCQARWRQNVGYVPQDSYILEGSILENVAFDVSADLVDEHKAESALDRAQLRDLIASMPSGLDSQVGEHGGLLSGGQRQRLGIARALYRSPRLLVLDEATSALDNETEHEISEAIYALAGSASVIVVAHRLSTIRHVDRVLFLKDGRVAGVGSFDELRQNNEDFARMVSLGSLDLRMAP